MKTFIRTLLAIFIIFILTLGLFFWLGSSALNKIDKTSINQNNLNIKDKINADVKNIALFGLDSRSENNKGRSDSIMIATINPNTKKIKLTSIMRDIATNIEGYGIEKLNHAYAYGGPELAIKTLNTSFDLNISDYITVDFYDLANIVNLIGGVNIQLKNYEPEQINRNLSEINKLENLPEGTDYINESGLKLLNGRQAVAYSRIRKEGNGDYERTQRQKYLLEQVFKKIQQKPTTESLNLITDMFKYIETSLSIYDIVSLVTTFLEINNDVIEQFRIPVDGTYTTGIKNGMWLIEIDFEKNINALHDYMKN